jgi:hypothetical protein
MDRKQIAILLYQERCFVCHKKYGKNFQFHHKEYEKGEKKWKDFKNAEEYWQYVSKKIIENPKRFVLLCKKCHWHIDKTRGGLSRMNKDKVVRLFIVTLETIKS